MQHKGLSAERPTCCKVTKEGVLSALIRFGTNRRSDDMHGREAAVRSKPGNKIQKRRHAVLNVGNTLGKSGESSSGHEWWTGMVDRKGEQEYGGQEWWKKVMDRNSG